MAGNTWTPRDPQGVARETPLNEAADETGDVPWEHAPPTSHISRFRFWDAREHKFIRKFGQQGGASQLHVVFRDEKLGGEGPEYWYFFADANAGANIFAKMQGSPHPYGEVLHPFVIKPKVIPYQRESK